VALSGVVWGPHQLYMNLDKKSGSPSPDVADKRITIWNPDDVDFMVTSVDARPGHLQATVGWGTGVSPVQWATTLRLGPAAAALEAGNHRGVLRFTTTDPDCPTVEVPYELDVWN